MAAEGLTARGIAALRAGDRAGARALLAAAVRADPGDARAWLWLSGAVDDPVAQRDCLERALALDPASVAARAGLAALATEQLARCSATSETPGQESRPGAAEASALPLAQVPSNPLPRSPWRAIWLRPRAAFRMALARPSAWGPWLAAAAAGVGLALAWAARRNLGVELGPGELLALALLAGGLVGAAALLLAGVLLRTGGRLLGGGAGAVQVRTVLGLALAPALLSLGLWLVQLALLPGASFGGAPRQAQQLLATVCGAIHGALWLWAAALSLVGLAEAHGLSLARAAVSWLIGALVVATGAALVLGGAALMIGLIGG